MKKKDLLAMRKLTATDRMLELVRQDEGKTKAVLYWSGRGSTYQTYDKYQYYRATVQNGILKVAVFSRKHLAAGDTEPEYEIYLSKEENTHLTYHPSSGKWRKGKIDSLNYDIDDGYIYGNNPWASENTKKTVNDYLGTGTQGVKQAILNFQNKIGKERLKKKHKSELEEIDTVMNTVPPLPKGFDRWVLDSAFIHERYLIYKSGDKENKAYCTHCRKTVKLKITPKHNKNGVCPSCKSNALLKAWRKQRYLVDDKYVGIIQKLTDGSGYILRRFFCKTKRTQENDWKLEEAGCWECNRYKLNDNFRVTETFEWGKYKNTGINRWCYERNHGYFSWHNTEECVLYHRNLKNLRKGTKLHYIPVEDLWRNNQGCYCVPAESLRRIAAHPQLEYLIKARLYRLAWDLKTRGKDVIDWNQTNPWKALKIQKEQLAMCIRMNITARQLEVLQEANESGVRLTEEQIIFFTREIGPNLVKKIFRYGHPGKFEKYLKALLEEKGTRIGDYIDYLEDIEKLRIRPTQDMLFPKNFQQTHQRLALQRQEKEEKLKKMEIARKNELLQTMLPQLREIYSMEDNNFIIILPTCKEDFNREGRENHNCVGGSYFDKMLRGESCVMFLRRKEDPEKAFCTVEMRGSEILQNRAVRNSMPPKEAREFMEKFSREVEKRIQKKKKELRNQTAV